ncbi:MAG: alpha-amylase family glycosyl hydrolase [Candidatus Nanopelagicaceae bacterium]
MKKLIAAAVVALSFFSYSAAAEDLTALARPTVRGGAANSQIYFVMTDRFANGDASNDEAGLTGFSAVTGYDPTDIGYFHGGDLKGLTSKLDYIQGLGFNSIWITPPVKQRYVQGDSAAYHGYWGLDFTTIDPHLGTEEDFKNFVSQAHSRGIKVIVDIVINHTADVIKYKGDVYSYSSISEYPYKDCNKKKFDLVKFIGKANFPKLCAATSFPVPPIVSDKNKNIKAPAFLNDITNYHNRGDSTFNGESSTFGDFFGLDDVFTEKPAVVAGWTKVWQDWITKFDIDGYRIDTAKHVNPEFWKVFLPAVLKTAASAGKSYFPIYGEVWDTDPNYLAKFVTDYKFPGVLDFAFQAAASKYATYGNGERDLLDLFNQDDLYTTATTSAYGLTTFLDNHDMGRIGMFLQGNTEANPAQLLERANFANALLVLLRGGPATYYGDEKGMTGSGGDKAARQDMFPTQVTEWQKEVRIGGAPIGNMSAFDILNPIETSLSELQKLAEKYPALRSGTQQLRYANDGAFAVSRYLNKEEFLVAFNGRDADAKLNLPVSTNDSKWSIISGKANDVVASGKTISLTLPARSWVVLKADSQFAPTTKLAITLNKPVINIRTYEQYVALTASVPGSDFTEVTFAVRVKGKTWTTVGTSDRRILGVTGFKDGL